MREVKSYNKRAWLSAQRATYPSLYLFTLLFIYLFAIPPVFASRAKQNWQIYTQPDGTTLTLTLVGDEYFHCYQALDGTCYLRDGQGFRVISPDELRNNLTRAGNAMTRRILDDPKNQWDSNRIYRQAVVLVTFTDTDFGMDDPKAYYNRLFNEKGYNTRAGIGSVADYFRDQSNGLFNAQFDIYGPVRVNRSAKSGSSNASVLYDATKIVLDSLRVDFSPYDWDGNGEVDQVVFVTAGYCANGGGSATSSYMWPSTGTFGTITTSNNLIIRDYSASAEKWYNDILCGIGTICHEFSHCLGLPDLYPTSSWGSFSVVDEWDLMDGGNYTDWGWCPPNYSVFEKYLLGWLSPEEVSHSSRVYGLKPLQDGGSAYRISKSESEVYLIENRQQHGWDLGLPGQGLLITYVNFDSGVWADNRVNADEPYRYDIIHADGRTYDDWEAYLKSAGLSAYVDNTNHMNRRYLSTSTYPLTSTTSQVFDCELPIASITNIQMISDGSVSFDVSMVGDSLVDVPLMHTGIGTFYSSQRAYRLPAGCVSKVVSSVTDTGTRYLQIAKDGGVIPKGVPVILVSEHGAGTVTLEFCQSDENYSGTNLLVGSDMPTMTFASGSGESLFYKLSYGQDDVSQFGWFWGADDGAAFRIGGHRAWLALPKSSSTRSFLSSDDATAISSVLGSSPSDDDRWYDLLGRQFEHCPQDKGIYIHHGKKIVVR